MVGHDVKQEIIQSRWVSDYSKGFGGKFGVQNDRMDKVRRVCVCRRVSRVCSCHMVASLGYRARGRLTKWPS